ncbi:MAG: hypothetical protein JO116_14930, partial [Planctomycetaceae bacterium]|nr:hypothetical protein [Planctomycetaceae bacterium]
MKLSDLLPNSEQLAGVQGIERSLLQRRQRGTVLTAALAVVAAVLQAALLLSHLVPLPQKGEALTWTTIGQSLKGPEGVVFALILVAVAVYMTVRYTGFLFKESKEPF